MPHLKADFGSGMVNAKPAVRNDANTAWVDAAAAYVRNDANSAWIEVWAGYTPIAVFAPNVFEAGPGTKTGSSTASVSGGDGSYTIQWTLISGPSVHTGSLTGATVQFSGTQSISTYRVAVDDGITTDSHDITVNFEDLS